jgi:N-acetyl-anhydromuramyl-L-alanine amidase AmpD
VNPVELGEEPGLPQAAEDSGIHRPLSDFVVVQGEEVQQWGYTASQLTSLVALVQALGHQLPRIEMRVPGDGRGAVPRGMVSDMDALIGIIGHLHVARRAMDPGAGFGWEAFARAIGQR